ncbi:hypothetical protein ASPBRDRAFT_201942 [Aspergillus brasiliensis CBS 101740]|uniref:Uncharacterized protein n=1 Tax=Aspergillus brasiliensis (strain CBS 101740 / IMI 381727 / IBT 21946) TaxID=767769 RepID=A0A1L9UZ62_ASPBC|nr:hypothetical protein ASPBRDRAFT_201942 [Aspergillus brasiliensis CBS 101740]
MATPEIWHRQFTRAPGPDVDTLMTGPQQLDLKDRFGQFLKQDSHWTLKTLHEVLSYYYDLSQASPKACDLSIFMIADGAHIDRSTLPNQGGSWFKPHCRIVGVVSFPPSTDTIFIVGSDEVRNSDRFLQAASWDGKAFHYYAVESINDDAQNRKWTYQANSSNAFSDDMSYLGPFNGHVNGACIMKELHDPWYHWKTPRHDLTPCLSDTQVELFRTLPYLSPSSWDLLGNVDSAEKLEHDFITKLVSSWFAQHHDNDFMITKTQYKTNPANLHRWMAHLLLTTTINIATGSEVVAFAVDNKEQTPAGPLHTLPFRAPVDLFMNFELLLQEKFGDINKPLTDFSPEFSGENYDKAVQELQLSLLQEWDSETPPSSDMTVKQLPAGTLGGGKQTDSYDIRNFLIVKDNTEGIGIYFTALQTSFEDARGVMYLPDVLVSDTLLKTILLLDFYNPVYSWRRGVLMQYLPDTTTLLDNGKYDMEAAFVDNIRASSHASETDSPESRFLALYDNPPSAEAIKSRFKLYLDKVNARLLTYEGMVDYLSLAESRRRIYRPLPLDEFGLTLPYALGIPPTAPLIEMTEDATITPIPERGCKFLNCWTGTLHGFDPKILPQDGCYVQARGGRCPRK